MSDSLIIFGKTYTGVPSILAKSTGGTMLQYIRPQGSKTINQNGTGIDVAAYETVDVNVSGGGNDFVVTLGKNAQTGYWEPDKTYAEIVAAAENEDFFVVPDRTYYGTGVSASFLFEDNTPVGGELNFRYGVHEETYDSYTGICTIIVSYYTLNNSYGLVQDFIGNIYQTEDADAIASEVANGKIFYNANGRQVGTYTGGSISLQSKSATPSTSSQVIEPDSGYDGLSAVTIAAIQTQTKSATPSESTQTIQPDSGKYLTSVSVAAISSTYVGTGIARKSSSDLTASGATVSVPAGYYESAASMAVASGSATTPATTITANPAISVSASGLITATASASQSVTPTVSAGYVSSGTAGDISVSGTNTQQLSIQASTTITPTKSSQTAVASGKYTTGTVTVAAIPAAYQDVTGVTAVASDVVSGKDIVNSSGTVVHGSLVIQYYYTGSSTPSSSLGDNGDIYLQTGG